MTIDIDFFKNRQKSYLHFDYPLSPDKTHSYVTESKNIEKHSFYPFIYFDLTSYKVKKSSDKKIKNSKGNFVYKVEKCPKKIRPIKYCAHTDGHIYAYYTQLLTPHYENILSIKSISKCVLAFRKLTNSPNNIHFAKEVFTEINNRQNCLVSCWDIKNFFEELDHQILKKSWLNVLNVDSLPNDHYQVFKAITKYSYVEKNNAYKCFSLSINNTNRNLKRLCTIDKFREKIAANELKIIKHKASKGIPQGSPISAFLSNIYMLDFDIRIEELMKKINGKYYRYCDDIIVVCDSKHEGVVHQTVRNKLENLKLQIHPEKTKLFLFKDTRQVKNESKFSKEPLQYLGFTYDGEKILLRHSGLVQYSHKVNKAIRMSNKKLIRINYARYHRGEAPLTLNTKQIFKKFSYLGKRNYLSYALRASFIMQENAIKKQVFPHWKRIQSKLNTYEQNHTKAFFEKMHELKIKKLQKKISKKVN